jgi:signal transduction histidine kinase
VETSVADTGPGIAKELQDRIFEPYFTTERSGTGLGLAIAKRIVTAHNGTIKLDSFPGGTVFSIRIPAAVSPS